MPGLEKVSKKYKKVVLIVDDDSTVLRPMKEFLELSGYKAFEASSAEEGLKIYRENNLSLIISDVMLPEMSGFEFLKKIRSSDNQIGIIIITGYSDIYSFEQAIIAGADHFIIKPVRFEELKAIVDDILDKSPLNRVLNRLEKSNQFLRKKITTSKNIEIYETQEIREFVGTFAHSLKNEIALINSFFFSLKRSGFKKEGMSELIKKMEQVVYSIEINLLWMTDCLKMGGARYTDINLSKFVKAIYNILSPRLSSNINFSAKIDKDVENKYIHGNTEQLLGALIQLVDNSTRAIAGKKGKIDITFKRKKENIIIRAEDNGPGIPNKIKDIIFRKKVKSKTGQGMGLFYCRRLISKMDGTIFIKKTSGNGTIIDIEMPLK
jgi:FixJ family two-component response regulator